MNNPFQDQLLKAGLVTKKQVQKANQDKNRNRKKQQHSKKVKVVDETRLKAQQAAEEKAKRDRELNRKKEEQARQKAISIEINQLIENNCLARDDDCEIVYNFEHNNKIKRVYVNPEMKQQIVKGSLGIARIEGRYELVPRSIAEKIQQRNAKRIVIFDDEKIKETQKETRENDPYSGYEIPDDLIW
ncbi:MAG: DUF2058 domain-containing protein [Gammaproteobacteria bacterium]|nr:DUF2058 domain-containing protein [Gammaproteobacteria bacterium]